MSEAVPRSICVVMLSAIGDAVHVLPVVTALKRAWPDTRITWILQPVPAQVAQGHPAVDEVLLFERRRGLAGLQSFRDVARLLRGRQFDLVLDLQVYFKAGVITALTRAPRRLGFDRARARDANWLFTNERIRPHPWQHVQDQYFEFLHHLGVDPEPVEWQLKLSAQEAEARDRFYEPMDGPVAALVLGTSKPEKNWTVEGYAEVVETLESDLNVRTVLVGGPSQVERRMADALQDATGHRSVDALTNDLRTLIGLLDGADLVISPDTGPLHLARALDTPVVGLYGYTNPKRYGPYRKYQDLVVDGYARYPGEDYPAEPVYRDGMHRVRASDVVDRVRVALDRYVDRGSP